MTEDGEFQVIYANQQASAQPSAGGTVPTQGQPQQRPADHGRGAVRPSPRRAASSASPARAPRRRFASTTAVTSTTNGCSWRSRRAAESAPPTRRRRRPAASTCPAARPAALAAAVGAETSSRPASHRAGVGDAGRAISHQVHSVDRLVAGVGSARPSGPADSISRAAAAADSPLNSRSYFTVEPPFRSSGTNRARAGMLTRGSVVRVHRRPCRR